MPLPSVPAIADETAAPAGTTGTTGPASATGSAKSTAAASTETTSAQPTAAAKTASAEAASSRAGGSRGTRGGGAFLPRNRCSPYRCWRDAGSQKSAIRGNTTGCEVRRLRLESSTKAAIDQKRFVGAACVGLLESCNIDWCRWRVGRCDLCRVARGINSTRGVRIASETPRRADSTTTPPTGEASTIAWRTATAEIPAASAPAAAEPATAKTTLPGICGKCADLQGEINLSGGGCNLNLALLRRETEHSDVNCPCAGGHIGEFEIARSIGERGKGVIPLRGPYGSARQRLAARFHRARLRQHYRKRSRKQGDSCQSAHIH